MRTTIVGLGVLALMGVAACSSDDTAASDDPSSAATSIGADVADQTATAAVDRFYTSLGERDCVTMRTLVAPTFQRDDNYWSDGCIDELQESVGDNYAYEVSDAITDGEHADYLVQRTRPDGSTAEDAVVMVRAGNSWLVESRATD